ncbi:MAG: thioesterase [Desulfobacteraceae bacterium IS3]|nr:MAG: thioesterase [Desulfobacteraceae bacterium IS3]HAO21850.1 thioesterase [Desulfobacteraceae bacterium]
MSKAFQDYYSPNHSVCFGCGEHNRLGLRIKSIWEGDAAVCRFTPKPEHTAFPGVVYGGLIASLIDCHGIATAIAAAYRAENRDMDTMPPIMYVTGNLNVSFLKPTPMNTELILKAEVKEMKPKKMVVLCSVFAGNEETAKGEVIAIRMPTNFNLPK